MSKTKQKNKSELEHLRGQIKSLRSQNRQLRKRVNQLDKKAHFYEEIVDEVTEDITTKAVCQECGKGTLHEHDFTHIIVTKCDLCDYKKTRKPRKKT